MQLHALSVAHDNAAEKSVGAKAAQSPMQKRIRKIIAPSFTIKKTNLNVVKIDSTDDVVTSPNKKDPKRQASDRDLWLPR